VIIRNLDLARTGFAPDKTDSVLFVDTNAVLTFPISDKRLEAITGRNLQFFERLHRIELVELPRGNCPELLWTGFSGGFRIDTVEDVFSGPIAERFNH